MMKTFERKVDLKHGWFKCPLCDSRIELSRMNTTIYGGNKTFFSQYIKCDGCSVHLYAARGDYELSYVNYEIIFYNHYYHSLFISTILPKLRDKFI